MSDAPYLTGRLLLAMPGIGDPRFERTVIAMCVHDDDGAMGLIVNRPQGQLSVKQLMKQVEIDPGETPEVGVLAGGPVEPGRGFVLHTPDYEGQDTVFVAGRWALTGTLDVLRAIAVGKGPRKWLLALGYAGWGAGQLDAELKRHGWHAADADEGLWATPLNERWAWAYARAGIAVGSLSAVSGTA